MDLCGKTLLVLAVVNLVYFLTKWSLHSISLKWEEVVVRVLFQIKKRNKA